MRAQCEQAVRLDALGRWDLALNTQVSQPLLAHSKAELDFEIIFRSVQAVPGPWFLVCRFIMQRFVAMRGPDEGVRWYQGPAAGDSETP